MLSEELQIYQDTKLLCKTLMSYQQHIPKSLRYGEYATAISLAFRALDMIYRCNSDKVRRARLLDEMICLLGGVRDRVNIFAEAKQMQIRQATNAVYVCEKALKQARAWRNASVATK